MQLRRMSAPKRRHQILSRAAELFATHGYEGTRIRQIAKACQISDGAIFHFFKNKKDLHLQTFIHVVKRQIPLGESLDVTRENRLAAIAENMLEGCRKDPSTMRLLLQTFLSDPEQTSFYYQSVLKKKIFSNVNGLLEQGISHGEYRNIDIHLATLCFLGNVFYLAMCQEFFGPESLGGQSSEQLADSLVKLFLGGVRNI
jgi:TetR/AcrR family transcriptional regulator, cholesterol catabolism regulator